jgi:hypothetical protein
MAFAPVPYELDAPFDWPSDPFGMALKSGRLVATVVSKKSGKHITVGARAKHRVGAKFRGCDLSGAERIYLDVPSSDGAGGKEIGCLHLEGRWAGKIMPPWDEEFDRARLWAAMRVLDVALGREAPSDHLAEILEGKDCLMCGRELTDPESIARNIGPDCWKRATGTAAPEGTHQRPGQQMGLEVEEEGNAEDGPAMVFEQKQAEAEARVEIEAELQQTAVEGGSAEDLGAGEDAGELFTLNADDDPRELMPGGWARVL